MLVIVVVVGCEDLMINVVFGMVYLKIVRRCRRNLSTTINLYQKLRGCPHSDVRH
jgi:hypothetical protein